MHNMDLMQLYQIKFILANWYNLKVSKNYIKLLSKICRTMFINVFLGVPIQKRGVKFELCDLPALENNHIREWTCQINNRKKHPFHRTYAKFKSNLRTQPYLTTNPTLGVKKYQMNIGRFRVNFHQLSI